MRKNETKAGAGRITKDVLVDRMVSAIEKGFFDPFKYTLVDIEQVWCEIKTEICGQGWERFAQNSYAHGGKLTNGPRDAWLEEVSDLVGERIG